MSSTQTKGKSAYIIDTPPSCGKCPLCNPYFRCFITKKDLRDIRPDINRDADCPLVKVKMGENMKGNNIMKIYISGKITGTDDYMKRFQAVEKRLTAEGYKVFNPAHANSFMPEGTSYEEYMKVSFCLLNMADAIYMMDGWEDSKGAVREFHYAAASRKDIFFEGLEQHQRMREWKDNFLRKFLENY